jgi:hypothetical protein
MALGILELVCSVGLIVPVAFYWQPALTVVAATVLAIESLVFVWVHAKYRDHAEYRGRFPDAIVRFRKAYDTSGALLHLANVGHAFGKSGNRSEALRVLTQLMEFSKTRYVSPYSFPLVYIGLGDREKACEWLQKAVTERSLSIVTMKVDPVYDDLRTDPRFASLLRQIGL